jgi:hypothetical protein
MPTYIASQAAINGSKSNCCPGAAGQQEVAAEGDRECGGSSGICMNTCVQAEQWQENHCIKEIKMF